jgi:hypothetical protein
VFCRIICFLQLIKGPFASVHLRHTYAADILCSLNKVVVSLMWGTCYFTSGSFFYTYDPSNARGKELYGTCHNDTTLLVKTLIMAIPYTIRFFQCLRQRRDHFKRLELAARTAAAKAAEEAAEEAAAAAAAITAGGTPAETPTETEIGTIDSGGDAVLDFEAGGGGGGGGFGGGGIALGRCGGREQKQQQKQHKERCSLLLCPRWCAA